MLKCESAKIFAICENFDIIFAASFGREAERCGGKATPTQHIEYNLDLCSSSR